MFADDASVIISSEFLLFLYNHNIDDMRFSHCSTLATPTFSNLFIFIILTTTKYEQFCGVTLLTVTERKLLKLWLVQILQLCIEVY